MSGAELSEMANSEGGGRVSSLSKERARSIAKGSKRNLCDGSSRRGADAAGEHFKALMWNVKGSRQRQESSMKFAGALLPETCGMTKRSAIGRAISEWIPTSRRDTQRLGLSVSLHSLSWALLEACSPSLPHPFKFLQLGPPQQGYNNQQ